MQMNVGTVLEMVMPFVQMGNPEAAEVLMEVASATGLEEFSMSMACGSDSQKGYMIARLPGWGAMMRSKGALPVEGITAEDLALLPANCTMANIQSVDVHALFDMMLGIAEPYLAQAGFDRPLERIEEMVGVHLERDLLDHLGTHMGSYLSDSTGGGGLFSTVMFIEVKDPVKLSEGLERVSALFNGALAGQVNGYVQMRTIERDGMACRTLTFPGLPIPFEPTMVMGKNNLFVGLTPQAAVAAALQEGGSQPSLMTNNDFLGGFDGNFSNLYGVSYFAPQAFLREGYGMTTLMCSALSNGVRSRMDATRDAGLVLPTFGELTQGVRATVGTTRLEANGDMVTKVESDPSMMVGLTRAMGYVTSNPTMLMAILPVFMANQNRGMVESSF